MTLLASNLPLPLLSRGKVRDIYALPSDTEKLLFVASDRISAFDVVMENVSFCGSSSFFAALGLTSVASETQGHSGKGQDLDSDIKILVCLFLGHRRPEYPNTLHHCRL